MDLAYLCSVCCAAGGAGISSAFLHYLWRSDCWHWEGTLKSFGSGSPALKLRKAKITKFWATSRSKIAGTFGAAGVTAREVLAPAACVRLCDSHVTQKACDKHKAYYPHAHTHIKLPNVVCDRSHFHLPSVFRQLQETPEAGQATIHFSETAAFLAAKNKAIALHTRQSYTGPTSINWRYTHL